jgi:hypothetical protein
MLKIICEKNFELEKKMRGGKMDFINKHWVKITDRVADTTETLKINSLIAEEEKKINYCLLKIGEITFEKNSEKPDASIAEFVSQLKNAQSKMEEYKQQICKLKGIALCDSCGKEVSQKDFFCMSCGEKTRLAQEQKPAKATAEAFCRGCGKVLVLEAIFCSGCGRKAE